MSSSQRLRQRLRRIFTPELWRQPTPWLVIFGVAIVWLLAWGYLQRQDLREQGNRTIAALCALRADKERQKENAQAFLIAHPNGGFGVTPNDLRTRIADEQRTIDALSRLNC